MMNNIITALAIILLVYMTYPKIMIKFNKNVKNINGEEVSKLIRENKNLVIIDVRSKGEYRSGHKNGAKLFPVSEISSRILELEKFRGKPILVHCASGNRSPRAVRVLLKNKFTSIYHLSHGLAGYNGSLIK
jgi:rhodanese-related sulfurtransferase